MPNSIPTKVVLVTNGANDIGKEICRHLINNKMTVIAIDQDEDAGFTLVADEPRIRFRHADLTKKTDIEAVIKDITAQFCRLDGLVNNSTICEPYNTPIASLPIDEWQHRLNVNLTSPLMLVQQCLPLLKKSQGNVVNITSPSVQYTQSNTEAYHVTNSGLISLTHALSISLGPEIGVNCISPGWINSEEKNGTSRFEVIEDVARMVEFLLCSQSGFITGQNFVVDSDVK